MTARELDFSYRLIELELAVELERARVELTPDRDGVSERLRLAVELGDFLMARAEELRLMVPSRDSAREGLRAPLLPTLDFKAWLETNPFFMVRVEDRLKTRAALPAIALLLLTIWRTPGCLALSDIFPSLDTLLRARAALEMCRAWSWLLRTTVKAQEFMG